MSRKSRVVWSTSEWNLVLGRALFLKRADRRRTNVSCLEEAMTYVLPVDRFRSLYYASPVCLRFKQLLEAQKTSGSEAQIPNSGLDQLTVMQLQNRKLEVQHQLQLIDSELLRRLFQQTAQHQVSVAFPAVSQDLPKPRRGKQIISIVVIGLNARQRMNLRHKINPIYRFARVSGKARFSLNFFNPAKDDYGKLKEYSFCLICEPMCPKHVVEQVEQHVTNVDARRYVSNNLIKEIKNIYKVHSGYEH